MEKTTVVDRIHNDFHVAINGACDYLQSTYSELESKFKGTSVDGLYTNAAIQNFFKNAKEVVVNSTKDALMNTVAKEQYQISAFLDELNKIKVYLPYKLINYASVDKLCKKYNLVVGNSKLYTESLPASNLKDIKNFVGKFDVSHSTWLATSTTPLFQQRFEHGGRSGVNRTLYVVGPINYFKTEGMMVVGRELVKHPKENFNVSYSPVPTPDPVVLAPIRFESVLGKELKMFAIITAWGIEAKDPAVFNPQLN